MTLFLWDQSHFDGVITRDIMVRAKVEGIVGVTHKIGEGTGGDDLQDGTALAAARGAGIEFIGGYHVVRSGPVGSQVDELLFLADRDEPWWHDFPGWFWQADLERWSYDNVPAATGVAFAQLLRQRTGRQVLLYASRGQYGDSLTGWDGPLWNANYPSSRLAPFKDLYPGDNGPGWVRYSGQMPLFWQYASSATIAGLSTCDANAYRGTVDQLRNLINRAGDSDVNDTEHTWLANIDTRVQRLTEQNWPYPLNTAAQAAANGVAAMAADLAAIKTAESASLAAVQALAAQIQAGGGNVDVAPVLAAIQAARDDTHALVATLQQDNTSLRAQVADLASQVVKLEKAAAAGAQAEADALEAG
jgi:Glycosyl hydrolases family 25